jgi:hypothetical protein
LFCILTLHNLWKNVPIDINKANVTIKSFHNYFIYWWFVAEIGKLADGLPSTFPLSINWNEFQFDLQHAIRTLLLLFF